MTLRTKRNFNMRDRYLYLIQIGTKQEIARYYESSTILYGQAGFVAYSMPTRMISIDNVSRIEEIPDSQQAHFEEFISTEVY